MDGLDEMPSESTADDGSSSLDTSERAGPGQQA